MADLDIGIKRVYLAPHPSDGTRILVDRLWPRGISKEKAAIDHWVRDLAPSNQLRKWYGHKPERWDEFRSRYFAELDSRPDGTAALLKLVKQGPATFVYSSKEQSLNNAHALKEYLETQP